MPFLTSRVYARKAMPMGKITLTRMWADAQRDDHPAEYRWRPLQKFRNSIPCTTPKSLAGIHSWSAMQ